MSQLEQLLTPELREALNTPAGREALEALAARLTTHNRNPVYAKARDYWTAVQGQQIAKGAAKYPETLNPASWTLEQLVEHAMQENVDQAHYLFALKEKGDKMAQELKLGRMAGNGLIALFNMQDQPPEAIAELALATARGYYRVWRAVHGGQQ